MKITLDRLGTTEALKALLDQMDADAGVSGILILSCDANGFTPETLNPLLQSTRKPLVGGVFPQIIFEQEHLSIGNLVIGLPTRPQVVLIEGVSTSSQDLDDTLANGFTATSSEKAQTMFVFVDGFASRIGTLIDALFNSFGLDLNYLGAGCGSLSFVPKPCVLCNQGLFQDAAVLALFDLPSGIGVGHGWQAISEGLKVTSSTGNVIHTLDWRPAFEVYRETVEAHSSFTFANEDFFAIAKRYPFGIAKLGAEMVVRDPFKTMGEDLVCVGEVPQGAFVHILHGDQQSLLAAAAKARDLATVAMGESTANAAFIVDCISRFLFLEDQFALELQAVRIENIPTIGALTLGEIANSGKDYLEFYNKTAVIGLI